MKDPDPRGRAVDSDPHGSKRKFREKKQKKARKLLPVSVAIMILLNKYK